MHNFEEIYNQYSPQIFRVCMGYVNDPELAKDLTQDTFISVWRNLQGFRNEARISTWIFRIATNNCLRAVEKSKRIVKTDLPENFPAAADESPDEKLAFLYSAIAELVEIDRLIISLVLEDLPYTEIADIVGLSEGNIRVKVHRIKEKLAIKFRKHGQFE
jgi:RNA polymerase sigma-70 factor (ECF subfamily)